MKFVNEPAERVETELREQGATVRRERYNPRNRSLVSDFVGFLRAPTAGSTVTLFEDDDGRVRYYTVSRGDAEVDELRTRVEELSRAPAGAVDTARLDRIEERLGRIDTLERKVEAIPKLEQAVDRLPDLESRIETLTKLESSVDSIDALRTRVERLERPTRPPSA